MQSWPAYMANPRIRSRPIATIGAETPNLKGDFWITGLDKYTHLILPTIALILISLAVVHPLLPRVDARGDGPGLRPHGAGQGPLRARPWSCGTRSATR